MSLFSAVYIRIPVTAKMPQSGPLNINGQAAWNIGPQREGNTLLRRAVLCSPHESSSLTVYNKTTETDKRHATLSS
jgi:hypothetical protein